MTEEILCTVTRVFRCSRLSDLPTAEKSFGASSTASLSEISQEQEAVELFERAIRLSPNPPLWVPVWYGHALHLAGQKEEAAEWLKKAIGRSPKHAYIHARLAAVYVDLDRMSEAKAATDEALRLNPRFSVSSLQKIFQFQDPERNAWLKDLLVRAGLPE